MAAEDHLAGRQFVDQGPSPLDYGTPGVHRYGIEDATAPPAPGTKNYFTGRKDSAKPGTAAFADVTPYDKGLYVNYVATRRDYGGQGLARDLVRQTIQQHPDAREVDFGKMMEPQIGSIKGRMEKEFPEKSFRGKVYYR